MSLIDSELDIENRKPRLLLIDILKILGISLVLLEHYFNQMYNPTIEGFYLHLDVSFLNSTVYHVYYGPIGISIFLFASGLSLTFNYPQIDSWQALKTFYSKRVMRIYPAYYIAIVFAVVMNPSTLNIKFSFLDYFKLFTGLQSINAVTIQDFYGYVSGPFWFLTVVLMMYAMFPFLLYVIKKHPHVSISALFLISFVSRYYLGMDTTHFRLIDWFPLCRVFEFALGIYFIRLGFFFKTRSSLLASYLGNISFYIYLINQPIIGLWVNPIFCLISLGVLGTAFWRLDVALQALLSKVSAKILSREFWRLSS